MNNIKKKLAIKSVCYAMSIVLLSGFGGFFLMEMPYNTFLFYLGGFFIAYSVMHLTLIYKDLFDLMERGE